MDNLTNLAVSHLFAPYYKPVAGSIDFSLKRTSAMVGPGPDQIDDALVRARLDAALLLSADAVHKQFLWRNKKRHEPLRRQGVMDADNACDRAASNFFSHLEGYCRLSPTNPLQAVAVDLRDATMPEGVGVITTQSFEEQHAAVDVILGILDGPKAAAVAQLNLGPFVDELRQANQAYGEALVSRDAAGVTYDEVQAAHQKALNGFFGVVLAIWNNYLDDPHTRNKLLAVIHEQNARIARHYQRRNTVPEIDPDTGKIVEPGIDLPAFDDGPDLPVADTPGPVAPEPVEDPA